MFANLFTAKIMAIVAGVLVIALLSFGTYHYFTITLLEHKVEQLDKDLTEAKNLNTTLADANTKLTGSLEKQSASIKASADAQRLASVAASQSIGIASAQAESYRNKYDLLLKAPRTGDDCKDLQNLFSTYFNQLRGEQK